MISLYSSMSDVIPDGFWYGVQQFNQQEFYACHDTLEALWMDSMEPEKKFYQGVLQIAVGLYHLTNQNWRGAVMLMGEGIYRLDYYRPNYSGINVEQLFTQTSALLTKLQQGGPEKLTDCGQIDIPTIQKLKDIV